jgi:diacylglycerol kinase (ATP)
MRILMLINKRAGSFNPKAINRYINIIKDKVMHFESISPSNINDFMEELKTAVNYDMVILAGGDGTVGLATYILKDLSTPIYVIPIGRGNTFYKMIWQDEDPESALNKILRRFTIKKVDIGYVNEMNRYFILGVSLGLIAEIVKSAPRYRIFGGRLSYIIAGLERIFLARDTYFLRVYVNNANVYSGLALTASFGVTPIRAGRIRLFPSALIDDGLIDYIVIPKLSKTVLIKIFRNIDYSLVKYGQGSNISVTCDKKAPVEIDGDYVGDYDTLTIRVIPASLNVAVPL